MKGTSFTSARVRRSRDRAEVQDDQERNKGQALRRVLYGLYAIVTLHFAKEEEVYLPILDARLTDEEAFRMFEMMDRSDS